jgi:tRNA (guanosine-2'-O-)-methyltransferase
MRAENRQMLPQDPAKSARFPRTSRRAERIRYVLERRQPDLTVVLENVHDPHNIGAVLRSCDAVGVLSIHTIYTIEDRPDRSYSRSSSGSASKWIEVNHHDSVDACFGMLRAQGLVIGAAALTDDSIDLFETDLAKPVALVFGNEKRGVSDEAIAAADFSIQIPMMGMVESLNISVACAVTLFEALRQRLAMGLFERPRLEPRRLAALHEEWLRR